MSASSSARTFGFVGVTASKSSINKVFPRWAKVLDLGPVAFDPIDLPTDVDDDTYRAVVGRIAEDPAYHGALVTTHKVRLLAAARDLIDELDPHADLLGEVSCLSKRDGRLIGHAKDPITAGRSLEEFVPRGHFNVTDGQVLCLGAGGAGLAIAVYLLTGDSPAGRPDRVVLTNRSVSRLNECHEVLDRLGVRDSVDLVLSEDPRRADQLCADLPPASMVVNATGMGKDRPGSPLTDDATFPERGLVWELNYRGDLEFLRQARDQAVSRDLTIEDGWRYFIHGWSAVVAEVFDLDVDQAMLERLAQEAEAVRS